MLSQSRGTCSASICITSTWNHRINKPFVISDTVNVWSAHHDPLTHTPIPWYGKQTVKKSVCRDKRGSRFTWSDRCPLCLCKRCFISYLIQLELKQPNLPNSLCQTKCASQPDLKQVTWTRVATQSWWCVGYYYRAGGGTGFVRMELRYSLNISPSHSLSHILISVSSWSCD